MTVKHWLLLRGLIREQRHFGVFPSLMSEGLQTAGAPVTVHMLDLPGFGTEHARTSPRTVTAIVDDVRSRFVPLAQQHQGSWGILAISLGGMVALDWAARHDDFARVVVINTSAGNLSSPFARLRLSQWPHVLSASLRSPPAREAQILAMTSNHDGDHRALAATWARYFLERPPSRVSMLRQLSAAATSTLPKHLRAPALVLTAQQDRLVSTQCSVAIAQALALPLRVHPTAGHDLTLDDGPWVIEQVRQWLNAPSQPSHPQPDGFSSSALPSSSGTIS